MAATVIDALRRFLPAHRREHRRTMSQAQRRAVWAITHCRTAEMGGHLHACSQCGKKEFHFHSCNHRSCPLCGKSTTADWVERQLSKRIAAPYFMVNFTLPAELRPLFFTPVAKEIYQRFFHAASTALTDILANPRSLGATTSGFIMVLHTWNQRLQFHPHIHCIVPGAGLDAHGRVVTVKNANFLASQSALRTVFRARLRDSITQMRQMCQKLEISLPDIDPAVWQKDWGVYLKPFGSGENIIKYLGRYVCRTAITDARILSVTDTHVTFRYKDRANGDAPCVETVTGKEFVARYLRHVLPRGLRAIRYHGYMHPAAHKKHERIAFHTGRPLHVGAAAIKPAKEPHIVKCPCCEHPMTRIIRLLPAWRSVSAYRSARPPPSPKKKRKCA